MIDVIIDGKKYIPNKQEMFHITVSLIFTNPDGTLNSMTQSSFVPIVTDDETARQAGEAVQNCAAQLIRQRKMFT
jgi:hypothetical protein